MAVLLHYAPALLFGLAVTVWCWGCGAALGLLAGAAVALLYRAGPPPLRWLLRAAIETVRGTPFLVQLFVLYAGGPSVGVRLEPVTAGIVALAIYSAAYFAEVFRAGLAAVPRGQLEAAESLGMTPASVLRRVELPVMLVSILPALVNVLITLTKETVILSVITVPELMFQMQTMAVETFAAFQAIFAMAVLYWLLVELVSYAGRQAERRVTGSCAHDGADGRDARRRQEFRRPRGAEGPDAFRRPVRGGVPDRRERVGQEHVAPLHQLPRAV